VNTGSTDELERLLARKHDLMSAGASDSAFESRLRELRQWQAARLARTYADLHENPRYAAAVEFFLSDLYGAHDFAARDQEMMRAWRYFKRSLPEAPRRALARAIELDVLTEELDRSMAAALLDQALDDESYANAYRFVGRRRARRRQIDLVVQAGADLDRAVRHTWVGPLLAAAHAPARAAGFGALQDFIERGYRAFRTMAGADEFLVTLRTRESALMEALFSGAPHPFAGVTAEARS
jgi:hypothetical protein